MRTLEDLPARVRHIAAALAAAVLASIVPAYAADLPDGKKTSLGLYMTAKEALAAVSADPDRTLFLDIRTPAEVMFVGAAEGIDANVPFVDLAHPATWDAKNNRLLLVPNGEFVRTVETRLAEKKLGKSDRVVVMCRSGDRSSKAVNALASAGFTNVWTVVDGFEGDASKDGRRDVNGWKNAGLPWSYKLDKSKLDLAAGSAN